MCCSRNSSLTLPLLSLFVLAVVLLTSAAQSDPTNDAIAFAAFTRWCRNTLDRPAITNDVQEKSSFVGRWCRTDDGNLRSVIAYDLKADKDGFAKRRNTTLGDAPACEKSGGDDTFCTGGIEWVRGDYKFYIMLWRNAPNTAALGKALIATARQEALQIEKMVDADLRLGLPPPQDDKEPPIVRSVVILFDRSNCLSTTEGYKMMVRATRSGTIRMERRYEYARERLLPEEQRQKGDGAPEWALISYDGRGSTLEHDFTHKAEDTETKLSEMEGRAQVEQAEGGGGPVAATGQDLATHIARAALYANLFGRGDAQVSVVTCGAKPALSERTEQALKATLDGLTTFQRVSPSNTGSLERPRGPLLGGLPPSATLPWWACLAQAVLGQTAPRTLAGPNVTLKDLLAQWEAAGTRARRPTRVDIVGIRFPAGGEQEQFLQTVCKAGGGRYVPATTVNEMPASFLSLFPEAGQPWPGLAGTAAGPQVAQLPGERDGPTTVVAGDGDDELRLRDGRVLRGALVSADDRTVVFRTGEGVVLWTRPQVAAIILGQAAATTALPPEISLAKGLTAVRWMSFHRLPRFELGPVAHAVSAARISANGQRLVVAASEGGTASLNADGTGLVRLSEARNDGLVDISSDGQVVVWSDVTGLYSARSDGAGRKQLPGGFRVLSMRLTADGARVYVMTLERGILVLPTDGSDARRIVSLEQVTALAGTAPNANLWKGLPSGLDVANDGSRLVFHFGRNVMACNGDGSGLRRLTDFEPTKDSTVKMVRISGDGQRIGWVRVAPQLSLTLQDWEGGNVVLHRETGLRETLFLQLNRDGSTALTSHGARYYGGRDELFVNLTQWGQSNYEAIYNTTMASFTADARRVLLVADGGISPDPAKLCPLIIADLNSMSLGDVPPLRAIDVQPRFLLTDGTTTATATVQTGHANLAAAGLGALIGGELASAFYYRGLALLDKGKDGDEKAQDGILSSNALRISKSSDPKVTAGPMTLRVWAETNANDALVVDFTGVEARTP